MTSSLNKAKPTKTPALLLPLINKLLDYDDLSLDDILANTTLPPTLAIFHTSTDTTESTSLRDLKDTCAVGTDIQYAFSVMQLQTATLPRCLVSMHDDGQGGTVVYIVTTLTDAEVAAELRDVDAIAATLTV